MTEDTLAMLLRSADAAYKANDCPEPWPKFFARHILKVLKPKAAKTAAVVQAVRSRVEADKAFNTHTATYGEKGYSAAESSRLYCNKLNALVAEEKALEALDA